MVSDAPGRIVFDDGHSPTEMPEWACGALEVKLGGTPRITPFLRRMVATSPFIIWKSDVHATSEIMTTWVKAKRITMNMSNALWLQPRQFPKLEYAGLIVHSSETDVRVEGINEWEKAPVKSIFVTHPNAEWVGMKENRPRWAELEKFAVALGRFTSSRTLRVRAICACLCDFD